MFFQLIQKYFSLFLIKYFNFFHLNLKKVLIYFPLQQTNLKTAYKL